MARAAGGRLLLRIEDIDASRCRPEFETAIYEDLTWLGLTWEQPVRRQSEHFDLYRDALGRLDAMGLIYPSFESRAEIAALVAAREAQAPWPRDPDGAPLYPGDAKTLLPAERARRVASGAPYAMRLDMAAAMTRAGALTWLETGAGPRGETGTFIADPAAWGDVILSRKDAPGSYHLAVTLDDAAQGVTDVVRGSDLFHATSVHRLLQCLLGLPAPRGRLRLVFSIADSGIGISVAELKRLFKPFAQASEQIARRYGGAGLGLTFVKRIAKVMGGDLTVVSKPGEGSTFRLTVLVAPAEDRRAGDGHRAAPPRALSLVCAEDNPYGRVVMNTILTQLGHKVDFVDSGEAVVKAAARGGYDAVLMDVTLSGLDGLEATRRIRALPGRAGQIMIAGISGRGEAAHQTAALSAGMNFYFVKPISPGKLAQALATLPSPRLRGEGGEPR